jgi:hypothetical protein
MIYQGTFENCTQLKDLTVNWTTPLPIIDYAFYNVPLSACTLHVPAGTEALYKAAPVWKYFSFPESASLEVSPSSLDFTAIGGSKQISVTSNVSWTVSKEGSWMTVNTVSHSGNNTITVTTAANTTTSRRTATVTVSGGSLTHTITVTQEAGQQQIVVEPEQPKGGRGVIDIRPQLPINEKFTIVFIFHLPVGFHLDEAATSLIAELLADYELLITPNGANSWRFVIRPKTAVAPRAAGDMTYRQLLHIVYTMDETVGNGNYEMSLNDIDLTLNSGQVIHQDEINIPVRIDDVSNATVSATDVRYFNSRLYVNTPPAERITVYSLDGRMIYQVQKQPGIATFNLYTLDCPWRQRPGKEHNQITRARGRGCLKSHHIVIANEAKQSRVLLITGLLRATSSQ